MTFTICDLRERLEFFDVVVDRVWNAWWKPHGVLRADLERRSRESLGSDRVPTAFVAHDGSCFLGTASLIASDLDERPALTPWIAAVWVEPEARQRGVGRALVAHTANAGFAAGFNRIYLCARPHRRSFYIELGWTPIDENVGAFQQTVFVRSSHRPPLDASRAP